MWSIIKQPTDLINCIQSIDSSNVSSWKKWKSINNQVVVQTNDFYYKVYATQVNTFGKFNNDIREKLAEIYREDFGIIWNIKTIYEGNNIIQVEQRQKLKVCNAKNTKSFEQVFSSWRLILNKLEKKLHLPEISIQLQDNFTDLYKVKLIRECINKYSDYAYTPSGDIILLDDADFFLYLTTIDGQWFSASAEFIPIDNYVPNTFFVPYNYNSTSTHIEELNALCDKWGLLVIENTEIQDKLVKNRMLLHDMKHKMLKDNIEYLTTGLLQNNEKLLIP